ncbi:hypothetical protein HZ994_08340 [Akkermansiaceae bacterium]|nr:hypothetical protein HZ994_08340 [Akkermansiaceae bacterium]
MIRHPLVFLWFGLLSVGCDKPDSPHPDPGVATTSAKAVRRGHEPRGPVPGTPAALRRILGAASRIESTSVRERALADLAWNAMEIDPGLSIEAFLQLPTDSPERIRLIKHYAMRMAERDADEALAWAATAGSEQEIAAAKSQIALILAETDPHRAADLLSESGIVGHEFDVAVVQVIQRWAAKSSPDAAGWVSSFPPGAARQAGIRAVVAQWLPRDAAAAFAWLGTLQDGEIRTEAARAMEGVILQQPEETRESWLRHADASIRSELEQQRSQAILDVGDNIPAPEE